MKPLVTNIQRMCMHDGPGVRTTVFFKGCSLHCPWCANPENIEFRQQIFTMNEKCKESCKRASCCGFYNTGFPNDNDINECVYGVFDVVGKYYSSLELYKEIVKDKAYYGTEGGVTFSGGEALLFLECYEDVINMISKENISTCVETALFVPKENVIWATNKIDFFYVDIKVLNEKTCKNILGGNVHIFLENLEYLYSHIDKSRLIYRIPLVKDITYIQENIDTFIQLINQFPPSKIEIFSVHNLGEKKYRCLGKKYDNYSALNQSELEQLRETMLMKTVNIPIYINSI